MFEKEAEEYYYKTYPVTLNIGEEERKRVATDIFIKGAEFGYNKANEWHYVKDGDLPECEEYVWCLFKNPQFPFIAKLYFGMADNDFHWKCLATNEEYYEWEVYAWKEIVLPKESE